MVAELALDLGIDQRQPNLRGVAVSSDRRQRGQRRDHVLENLGDQPSDQPRSDSRRLDRDGRRTRGDRQRGVVRDLSSRPLPIPSREKEEAQKGIKSSVMLAILMGRSLNTSNILRGSRQNTVRGISTWWSHSGDVTPIFPGSSKVGTTMCWITGTGRNR